MANWRKEISEKVKAVIKKSGASSVNAFAQKCGFDRNTLTRIIDTEKDFQISKLARIAEVCDEPLSSLVPSGDNIHAEGDKSVAAKAGGNVSVGADKDIDYPTPWHRDAVKVLLRADPQTANEVYMMVSKKLIEDGKY